MAKIAVVTDSTASLPQDLAQAYGIYVQPTYISFGQQVFRDGIDITPTEFYNRLATTSVLPTTSQPSPADFLKLYSHLNQEADAIVSIHISQELSATLDSARTAQHLLENEAREKGETIIPIHILDSRSAAMGLGFIVLAAARAAMAEKSLSETIRAAETLIPRMNVIFTVETLEYLRRGGRIGGAAALLGTVLSIKPVLHILNGRVEVLEKVRTKKQVLARLLAIMAERLSSASNVHVAILQANIPDEAQWLAEQISTRFNPVELHVADICPVIGTHVGPGAIGLVFYSDV